MNNVTLTLVIGLPGAGKSTYIAKLQQQQVISFDSIRKSMGHEYHKSTEAAVFFVACSIVRVALLEQRNVMVDESITEHHLAAALVDIAKEYGADVEIVYVSTPVSQCRANRLPYGFPEIDFDRKVAEWGKDGGRILGLVPTGKLTRVCPYSALDEDNVTTQEA